MKNRFKYYIGIDCGVNTGICVWSKVEKQIRILATVKIHKAMEEVNYWNNIYPGEVKIRVEDARKRKWFGKTVGREQLQGAGSIKRDAKIWEDYLQDLGAEFEMVAPKDNKTKIRGGVFTAMTKYTGPTTEHARDAAMLVFGL